MQEKTYGILTQRDPDPKWHAVPGLPMTKAEANLAIQGIWASGAHARMFEYGADGEFDFSFLTEKIPSSGD